MKVFVKRVYEKPSKSDGARILADRLWPRGMSKSVAQVDLWLKELAPSEALRKWFHSDKRKNYTKFVREYKKELLLNKVTISDKLRGFKKNITLVTAVKDIEQSHIPTLVSFLNKIV